MINEKFFSENNTGQIDLRNAIKNPYDVRRQTVIDFSGIGSVFMSLPQAAYGVDLLFLYDEKNSPIVKIGGSESYDTDPQPPLPTEIILSEINITLLCSNLSNYFDKNFMAQVQEFLTNNPTYKATYQFVNINLFTVEQTDNWRTEIISNCDCLYVSESAKEYFYSTGGYNLLNIPMVSGSWYKNGESFTSEKCFDVSLTIAEILNGADVFNENVLKSKEPNSRLFYVPWVVFLDGSKAPNISVQIDIPENNEIFQKYGADMVCHFGYTPPNEPFDYYRLNDVPLLQMGYNTSFDALMKVSDPNLFEKITGVIEKFVSNFISSTYVLSFAFDLSYTDENGKEHKTDEFVVDIPYNLPISASQIRVQRLSYNDKSTCRIEFGYPDENDLTDYYPDNLGDTDDPNEPSDVNIDDGLNSSYNTISVLTTTYAMTEQRLKQLGQRLWSDGFLENIQLLNNSPIENLLSCKAFPFSINGTDEPIILGNVDIGVNGAKVGRDYNFRRTIGSFKIQKKYNSFLDYEPFTSITIYLPFIGYKEITPSIFMDKTIKIDYVIDLVTGTCKAIIFANDIQQIDFDGSCGVDVPITSSNRAQVEMGYVTSALGVVSNVSSGNVLGAIDSSINMAQQQFHSSTTGTASPSCSAYTSKDIFLIYNRPSYQDLKTFNHVRGRMCNLSKNLKSLTGFTKCNANTDLSHLTCTMEEKKRIRDLITSGVIL